MANNILLTYDISAKHNEVKTEMIKKGYLKSWTNSGITYYLPNTTLWKQNTTVENARNDLNNVILILNRGLSSSEKIKIERSISVEFSNWAGIPGDTN